MTKHRQKKAQFYALRYHGGKRNNGLAKKQYLAWRSAQQPPVPERCDNPSCYFFSAPLIWNGAPLALILEHTNGVNTDNRASNLRLLCPNCDSQNTVTRGGANAGRVVKNGGGFALVERDGGMRHVLPAETGSYELGAKAIESPDSAGKK